MVEAMPPITHSDWPRVTLLINENYCVPKWDNIEKAGKTESCQTLNVETLNYMIKQDIRL